MKAQEEFETLEQKRNENREIHDKMREEIKKMDQAVANSSTFIKRMKDKDPQQVALDKAISDFWDTTDVPREPSPVKIASYPSLESLNEEPKEELTEAEYEYYTKKRTILVKKMALANDVYLAHLQTYEQEDPKDRSQKYLFQFNELSNRLHKQFDVVAARLRLPFEQPLMTYPSLGNLMDLIQQEDMGDKNREYFQEMSKEIKIKNNIAQKVLNNRLSVIRTPAEKGKTNIQYKEYQKESKRLLDFCEKMIGKREREADYIELEQPEGVPKVREISKEKLNEELKEIIDQPQYVRPIGEDTLSPHYSREMSRYEPPNPIKQKEREDLLEKVREMTSEGSKGSKGEKLVEEDTDLSWDHEGLGPIPKSHKDGLNGSPKLPRVPKGPTVKGKNETLKKECLSFRGDYDEGIYPELFSKENEVGTVVPKDERQVPEIDKKNDKNDEKWDFESPRNLADKKTATWIKEQNEFLGKQKEREFRENRKVKDPSVFEPSVPIKVLQKQRANPCTKYEQIPQYLMDVQKGQVPHPPLVMTNKGDINWRGQGKRYSLKEKRRTQWGGYGKQYGTGGGTQAYRTDGTQTQGHNTAYESQRQGNYFSTRNIGNGQGGNGGDEDRNDRKKYRDTEVSFENDSHEESDTEDSYELEITPQQLSQVTPCRGALKIKLSKKIPIKITAGAPKRESGTMPMKPENIQSSKQSILSSQTNASSENTQTKRGVEAPLLITPIHLGNNEGQRKGIPIKEESNPKDSDNRNPAREGVTQGQNSGSQGNQGPNGVNKPPGNGGGGDSSGGTSEGKRFPGEGGGPPRRNGNQRGGEVMMTLTLVTMGMRMIFPPPPTPLSQR